MDRQKCERIRKRLEETFATVGDDFKTEFGVAIKVGRATYSPGALGNVVFKVELAEVGENGVAETKEVADFKHYAPQVGLKPEDFGKEFSTSNGTYNICGFKPKAMKYPILGKEKRTGRVFKFPARVVRKSLGYKSDPLYDLM